MKKILFLSVVAFMFALTSVSAATFNVGEFVEQKGALFQDDIYLAGETVYVSANIQGDAILAGSEVLVSGIVDGDILAIGASVDIVGGSTDDIRIIGVEIVYSGDVRDDLIIAGGRVRFSGDATVGGDAVIAASTVLVNGIIAGDLIIFGGEVSLNGIVNGNVNLRYTDTVVIGEGAVIGGDFTYSALKEIEIPDSVLIGGKITYNQSEVSKINKTGLSKLVSSFFIVKILMMLVVSLVAVLLFKRFSQNFAEDGHKHFWKNALIGLIGLVVTPILAIALLFSFVGVFAGIVLFSIGTTLFLVGKVYAGILLGGLLSKWFQKKVIIDWKWTVIGVVTLHIVLLIPVIGMIMGTILLAVSFGTILMQLYNKMWRSR